MIPDHPHAYTEEEQAFLARINRLPVPSGVPLSDDDFDRLHDLLGRYPTWEIVDGKLDYDRPITLNSRFQDADLAASGIENIMYRRRIYVRAKP